MQGPAMEQGNTRIIDGDTIFSPSMPLINIRIDYNFVYLGKLHHILEECRQAEEFLFVDPSSRGHITRMLTVHFQGFLENACREYDYNSRQTVQLGRNDYLYDITFLNFLDYVDEYPDTDLARMADYIRKRGYILTGEAVSQRFLRVVDEAQRHVFFIEYLESTIDHELSQERLQTDEAAKRALLGRAKACFEVVKG
jgi:hypothetical protein